MDKITTSPHVPMAIVGRGKHTDLKQLEEMIVRLTACGSVDTAIAMLAESLAPIAAEPGITVDHFEVCIACFSETLGPCNFYFSSRHQEHGPFGPIPAFTLYDFGGAPLGGGPQPSEAQLAAAEITADDFTDGLADAGLRLMELLRGMTGTMWAGDKEVESSIFWIGGHLDHAVVTAKGVTVSRLHQWGDVPFKKIQPSIQSRSLS